MEHIKEQRFHSDLTREDRLFYFTTCGWMMWNWLVTGLATGATLMLYDGAPFYPDMMSTWKLIETYQITQYGTSAKFINTSLKQALRPKESCDLRSLKAIMSTGSPLYEDDFEYVYEHVKSDVQLCSISGGTDIVGCFALGNPMLPVYSGLLQSASLGYQLKAYDAYGQPVWDTKGELVCESPFPSMPVSFWNDSDGQKYKKSYFETYENKWHHSDFIMCYKNGAVKVLGRSDATLNRAGVRIGTAEIYSMVELEETIKDSLVIHIEEDDKIILFVKMEEEKSCDDVFAKALSKKISVERSPRHKPDFIYEVEAIPYTRNGKKIEIAIKSIFAGEALSKINLDALADPNVLKEYRAIYESLRTPKSS